MHAQTGSDQFWLRCRWEAFLQYIFAVRASTATVTLEVTPEMNRKFANVLAAQKNCYMPRFLQEKRGFWCCFQPQLWMNKLMYCCCGCFCSLPNGVQADQSPDVEKGPAPTSASPP